MREYQPEDYSELCKWCAMRDIAPPPEWSLPPDGFIVDNIAAGFLILMNNQCAQIDFYISNPFADKIFRSRALDQITEELLAIAKEHAVKLVFCSTEKKSIKDRALRHGFNHIGHFMSFTKEI